MEARFELPYGALCVWRCTGMELYIAPPKILKRKDFICKNILLFLISWLHMMSYIFTGQFLGTIFEVHWFRCLRFMVNCAVSIGQCFNWCHDLQLHPSCAKWTWNNVWPLAQCNAPHNSRGPNRNPPKWSDRVSCKKSASPWVITGIGFLCFAIYAID